MDSVTFIYVIYNACPSSCFLFYDSENVILKNCSISYDSVFNRGALVGFSFVVPPNSHTNVSAKITP